MKILELCDFFSNYGSNFIPSLSFLEQKLKEQGHEVFFIFSKRNLSEDFYKWEKPFAEKHKTELFDFSNRSIVKNVVEFIKKNKIDIVHGHFLASFYLSEIKRHSPKNVMFFEHIHSVPYSGKKTLKCRIKHLRNIFLLRHDIPKICISDAMVNMTKYVYPFSKTIVCRNAIDFKRLETKNKNIVQKQDVLLFGYNYYVKGVDIAIEALDLINKNKNVNLDIVLSDNFEKNKNIIIEKYGKIPNFIHLLKPTNDIVALYKGHKIFLNASRSEGMSYAIVEAYYCGCNCVVSDVSANKEIDLPQISFFESENPNDLSEKIDKALNVKNSNSLNEAVEKFGLENWASKLIAILFGGN